MKSTAANLETRDEQRRANLPQITYPEELPVSGRRDEIAAALRENQIIIVCGETGSGKTTQLPKICLDPRLGARGITGLIGHTQPRRIAARATATRIAEELHSELGSHVGYKVRFTDKSSGAGYIKLMTDGILLAETQGDPDLRAYDTLIIDEAHERSLNIDFLLGYLKQLCGRRRDLKIIITSATIDAERFANHFAADGRPAPVIEVSGRLYPVEIRWRPVLREETAPVAGAANKPGRKQEERDVNQAIVEAVDECAMLGRGDVLVFLPGEREIRDAAEALRKHHPPGVEILPLFARLSAEEQQRIFRTSGARRIVLATNVAETSLTVPGIRFVVDTGTARVKRYSYRNKVEQLQVERVARAAANQRAGRCGRVAAGVCIRLYSEEDFKTRDAFTDPEILRSSLAAVILRMKALGLTDIASFPFIEPPPSKAISDGYQLLQELNAVDDDNALTPTGRELATLPLDPRIGRMILAARHEACLREMLIIASALSVQDPRERPLEAQEAADQKHQRWLIEGARLVSTAKETWRSEFTSYLALWKFFEDAVEHKKSNKKLVETCREHFVNHVRMREWRDVHSQLQTIVGEHQWRQNDTAATYEQLHRALLAGLLGNVGLKPDAEPQYGGARGIRFHLHPGSQLFKKAGRWIVAGELIDTTRLYARTLANIEPQWLESVGAHLLKKSYSDPHWEKRPAMVTAFERGSIHGLLLYSQRRVHYGPLNPQEARELFIKGALVEGEFDSAAPFFAHNQRLRREIEELEHKSRRPDVLVDDTLIHAFYDALIPPQIHTGSAFEHWRKEAERTSPKLLFLQRDDLMRHEAAGVTTELFPKQINWGGVEYALGYHFEPGSPRDGVTVTVPLAALNQINAARTEWLVPGMLKEKVLALLKSLPQRARRDLVPLPEFATRFVDQVPPQDRPLIPALVRFIREQLGSAVISKSGNALLPEHFKLENVATHLLMNFKLIDEHGRQLELTRNLAQLRAEHGRAALSSFATKLERNADVDGRVLFKERVAWDFGDLEELIEVPSSKGALIGYPALVDHESFVNVEVFDQQEMAEEAHQKGILRLFRLSLKDQVRALEKGLNVRSMALSHAPFGSEEELRESLTQATLHRALMQMPLPRAQAEFERRRGDGKGRLNLLANEFTGLAGRILEEHHALGKKLPQFKAFPKVLEDIQAQLQRLLPKSFLHTLAYERLTHVPRYLKAASSRLDKLKADAARDAKAATELAPLLQSWSRQYQAMQKSGTVDARLEEFRWLLEELRVSLFAQELKTPMPVSVKRLQKVWESYRSL